jgi:hypothetical protein
LEGGSSQGLGSAVFDISPGLLSLIFFEKQVARFFANRISKTGETIFKNTMVQELSTPEFRMELSLPLPNI